MTEDWKTYLLWFAQEHVDFRHAEIQSILHMHNITMEWVEEPVSENPYWIVLLPSDDAAIKIADRSISLRFCIELWASAENIEMLHKKLKDYPVEKITQRFNCEKTFKLAVETFCKHFSQKQKIEKIESFSYLPIMGSVNLKNPDICLQYIEYYGLEPNNIPEEAVSVFFGCKIAEGARHLITKLSLKNRKFIGNTSMDAQLSLLMANQAAVRPGNLVLDPFVGSGSLLVAAAYFGAYVFGTDIDFLMLHARTRPSRITQKKRDTDESIRMNMRQYGLEPRYLDVLVSDFALPLWRDALKLDSIITDPPYGIREATERIGNHKDNEYKITEEHLKTHIPSKVEYTLQHIYQDLLNFAAVHLNISGRLVCWFPVFREDYTEQCLPSHSCLKLIANSEQVLSTCASRRLLTYVKTSEPKEDAKYEIMLISDFRNKFFSHCEESRKIRRLKKAEIKEKARLEFFANKTKNELS